MSKFIKSEIPEYADVMTLKDFVERVMLGALIPDDGCGKLATETHEFSNTEDLLWRGIVPDEIRDEVTHVAWYNK